MTTPNEPLLKKYGIKYPPCGFDCPSGWVKLVDKLIARLIVLGWDKDLQQVKEKFGGLRFYIGSAPEAIYKRIHLAETRSFKICIVCGSSKNVVESGRYYTEYICKTCKEQYAAKGSQEQD